MNKPAAATNRWNIIAIVFFSALLVLGMYFVFSGEVEDSVTSLDSSETEQDSDELSDDSEFFELTAEDCTSVEIYDPETKECYYECDSEEECAAIEAQIDAELDALLGDYEGGDFTEGERPDDLSGVTMYEIIDGEPQGTLNAQEREVWNLYVDLVGTSFISQYMNVYETYDDPQDDTYAYVAQDLDDPQYWAMGANLSAFYPDGELDRAEAVRTHIHEFAHILTLNTSQLDATVSGDSCGLYQLEEGCTKSNSYIYQFQQDFWAGLEGWPGDEASADDIYDFYDRNQDQFVTDYAATNLAEDIAESFTAFVINERPEGSEIRDQKVSFFYDYPELMRIRAVMRQAIVN